MEWDIIVTPGVGPMGAPVMTSVGMCRTCMAESSDLQYIFFGTNKIMEKTLPELIEHVAQIKVDESDGLPHYVCEACINLAKSALGFKEQCRRSESLFKSRLNCYKEKSSITIKIEQCADVKQSENSDIYGPYQCGICTERFPFSNQLVEHVKNYHPEYVAVSNGVKTFSAENLTCKICNKNFTEKIKLLSHIERCRVKDQLFDNDASSNNCLNINYSQEDSETDNENEFLKPKEIKSEPEESIIDDCENTNSVDQFSLNGESLYFQSKSDVLTDSSDKRFACNVCPKSFARQDTLKLHILDHKDVKKHQCNYCEKGFNVLSTLKDHVRTHTGEKPFLCSTCGKGFSQNTNLKEHLRRHQGLKPFKCARCDQTFVSKGELDAHTRKHNGAHPYVCDICSGGFTTSSSLAKHKRIHTGEKPYQCDFCPMRFTALGTLKNHRRIHTGEKPYKCEYCEKAFAQKNDLVTHTRTHTGERPYVCTICGNAFKQNSALKTHFKIHNKIPEDHMKLKNKS